MPDMHVRGPLDPAVAFGRNAVRAALADLGPGSRVVVGVSGGADSLALAAVAAFVADHESWDLRGIVVDHRLQAGSDEVASTAVEQLIGLGISAEVIGVDVGTEGGPESAARSARYAALSAHPADAVLLAHTLDDQAETVLLGLGRGSGPRSIAGMTVHDGLWRRPLLSMRRAETERICRAYGLRWWSDPHNTDPAYRRSRLRAEVMPLLEEVLGGGVAAALARTADQVRADVHLLDELAAGVADVHNVATLLALPPALRTRVLRRAALDAGADGSALGAAHISELDRLVMHWHGQVRVELPGAISASRSGASLIFAPTPVGG